MLQKDAFETRGPWTAVPLGFEWNWDHCGRCLGCENQAAHRRALAVPPPLPVSDGVLFLDDWAVAAQRGLERFWARPSREREVLRAPQKLRSAGGDWGWMHSVEWDGAQLRLWHLHRIRDQRVTNVKGNRIWRGWFTVARSPDGVSWTPSGRRIAAEPACEHPAELRRPWGADWLPQGVSEEAAAGWWEGAGRPCIATRWLFSVSKNRAEPPGSPFRYLAAAECASGECRRGSMYAALCLAHSPDGLRWAPLPRACPLTTTLSNRIFWPTDCSAQLYRPHSREPFRLLTRQLFHSSANSTLAVAGGVRGMGWLRLPNSSPARWTGWADGDSKSRGDPRRRGLRRGVRKGSLWRPEAGLLLDLEGERERYRRAVYSFSATPLRGGPQLVLLRVLNWPSAMEPADAELRRSPGSPAPRRDTLDIVPATTRDGMSLDLSWLYAGVTVMRRAKKASSVRAGSLAPAQQLVTFGGRHLLLAVAQPCAHDRLLWQGCQGSFWAAEWPEGRLGGLRAGGNCGELLTKPLALAPAAELWVDAEVPDGSALHVAVAGAAGGEAAVTGNATGWSRVRWPGGKALAEVLGGGRPHARLLLRFVGRALLYRLAAGAAPPPPTNTADEGDGCW